MKLLISLSLIALAATSFAQKGNMRYTETKPEDHEAHAQIQNGETTLTVSGLLNAKADTFVAFFHITQVGETAEKTDSLMNVRIDRFKTSLRRIRRDTLSVFTDMISFVPKYDIRVFKRIFSKTYNEVPDGFELQKNVTVRYRNAADLNMIVTAAAQAEIYDLVKVDYFLSDVKKQYDQLRARCQEALKAQIKYFEGLGVRLDTVRKNLDEDFVTVLPQTRYGSYVAVSRPSLNAAKKIDITSTEKDKFYSVDPSPSRYYQAVPYSNYDVVINPVVNEPVVQLTYQVSVKYFLPAEAKKAVMLVLPNGQLQNVGEL
jgi:uncharacterized protein YggE